jgi:hypothetical protein
MDNLAGDVYEDAVVLMSEDQSSWVSFVETVVLRGEDDYENDEGPPMSEAIGVHNFVYDLNVFYTEEYGPGILIVVYGPIALGDWYYFTDPVIVTAFISILTTCAAMMREALDADKLAGFKPY